MLIGNIIDTLAGIKFSWMCGCGIKNKLYCFVCLLSNNMSPSPWTEQGVDDLQQLQATAKKHETSAIHLHNLVDHNILGKTFIRRQLHTHVDKAYVQSIRLHNKTVNKNRHMYTYCGA